MRKVPGLVAAALLATTASASPTGQVNIPSTDFQGPRSVHLVLGVAPDLDDGAPAALGLTVGLFHRGLVSAEMGLDLDLDLESGRPLGTGLGGIDAKLGLDLGALLPGAPALALGVYELGPSQEPNMLYALASRAFGKLGRLSLGYFFGASSVLVDPVGRTDCRGLLASWDRELSEISPRLWVGIDYIGTRSSQGALALGLQLELADNVAFKVAWRRATGDGSQAVLAQLEFDAG